MFTDKAFKNCKYRVSDKLKARHVFTTRIGGVSSGVYASWNLGENRGDDPECVRENYRILGEVLNVSADDFVVTKQVHETNVLTATDGDRHKIGAPLPYTSVDGLVTNVRNLPLLIYIADCVPVLMEDEKAGVIAAVHCGWKGSVADILGVAVKKMVSLGATPSDIHAAIGASIGACCFECDDEVPEKVTQYLNGDTEGLFTPGENGKTFVDLKGANCRRLIQLGLKKENIDVSSECTKCLPQKYWSHRLTNGVRGSMAAAIVLD